jgi:hypothetical protein
MGRPRHAFSSAATGGQMLVPLQKKEFICLYGGKRDAFDFNLARDFF